MIKSLMVQWEARQDKDMISYQCGESIYISDLDYEKYFSLDNQEAYTEAVFEYIEGEYGGFERDIIYYDREHCTGTSPIAFNFQTGIMDVITDSEILDTLISNKLSIYNPNLCITNSLYLKDVLIYLFSSYKTIEGLAYVFKGILYALSEIIPFYLKQDIIITEEKISLPFSHTFLNWFELNSNTLKFYYSQIEHTWYAKDCQTTQY